MFTECRYAIPHCSSTNQLVSIANLSNKGDGGRKKHLTVREWQANQVKIIKIIVIILPVFFPLFLLSFYFFFFLPLSLIPFLSCFFPLFLSRFISPPLPPSLLLPPSFTFLLPPFILLSSLPFPPLPPLFLLFSLLSSFFLPSPIS